MSAKTKPPSQPKKNKLSQKSVTAKTAKSARVVDVPVSGEKESEQLTQLKQRANELAALQATVLDISSPRPLPELLNLIMERACNLLRASSGGIYLCDEANQQVSCVVSYKTVRDFTGTILKYGEGAAGTVAQSGKSLIIDDYRTWSGRAQIYDQAQSFSAVMAVPLLWQGNVTGVIDVIRSENLSPFTKKDLELLNLFAAHAALAVENARLYNMLEQDLNERKKAEEALQKAEIKYRMLVERLPVVVYTSELGMNGVWHYISPQIQQLLGFSVDEWLDDSGLWYRQVHPEDRDRQEKLEEQAWARQEAFESEYRMFTRDNRLIWIRDSAQILPSQNNSAPIVQGVLTDITEHKRAKDDLKQSEGRYRNLFNTMEEGVAINEMVFDDDGNAIDYIILDVNPAFERQSPYKFKEALGKRATDLYQMSPEFIRKWWNEHKQKKETAQTEYYHEPSGRWFFITTTIPEQGRFATIFLNITERKNAEKAARESEEIYRQAIEAAGAVPYYQSYDSGMDGSLQYKFISEGIRQISGYGPEEFNSVIWDSMVQETQLIGDLAQYSFEEAYELARSSEIPVWNCIYKIKARDGKIHWVLDSSVELRDEQGLSQGSIGLFQDITARKQAEEALAASEAELRALFASMNDAILVIDREGIYRKIAPTTPDLLYKPSAELLGKSIWDVFTNDNAKIFMDAIQHVLNTRKTTHIEYQIEISEKAAWFEASVSPIDADNTIWVARNITERKQTEEALRKSDQRLQVFFNQSLDGFFFCNFEEPKEWKNAKNKTEILEAIITTQHFTDVNNAMLKQYGISREKFLSFTTKDVFAHDIEQGRKLRRELFDNGRLHIETFERRGDGTPAWFEGDYVCLYDGQERITGFFGIQRDITERKLAEQVQSALYEIANAAQTSVSLHDLFAFIHKALQSFMPAKNFYISIYDSQKDLLSFPYFVDEFDKAPVPQKPVNGLTEYVLRTKQPLLATPQVFKELINSKQVDLLGVASFDWIGVPLSLADETFGVMVVQTYTDAVRLTQNDLEFLTFVSTQAAMVIKRKQAEETLLQFREVMDESNDAIYFIDPETSSYIDFNKNAMKFLGYNKEELSQLGVIDIAEHINNMEEWQARVELIGKSDGIVFQTSYQRKDDSLFPVEVSARILNHDGKPIMVAVVRDITERTQAESARERQLQELTGLHAIASACAFAIDEDSLLIVASILIGEVLYPEDFGFFIVDKDGLLRPHPSYHQKNGTPNKFINLGQGLIGQAAQERRARRSGDVRLEANYIVASPTSLSELAVPIKINERVLGVINAESNKLNAFSEADERLLSTAADQIATALERIRLQSETAQRAKEFASLYETSTALSAENNLTPLLQVIVEHAASLLNASTGAMYLFNKSTQDLVTVVATSADIPLGIHLRLGEGVAGRVAQTQLPLRIDDYSSWDGRSPKYEGLIFHAILEVPMLFGGELIGVLNAAEMRESKRKFTEADERLLSLFAAQAAGAIHSARLRAETDQRAQEFSSLYETSKTLSTELDLNKLLLSVVENARNLLHTATSGMYLTIPGTDELELSMDTAPYIPLGSRIKFGEGVAGRVAQTRQPLRIDDYSIWEGRSGLYGDSPIRAVLEVPMLYRGELIGVLTADESGDSERRFTEADENLLTLFATQAAGAIHSARLLNETRRRADEFTTLYETTHDLAMQQDLSAVLDIITKRATTLLGVPNAAIILYDPTHNDLKIAATRGPDLTIGTHRKIGEGLAGRVAQSRQPLIIDDYSKWEHHSHLYDSIPYTAMMGVPLLYGGNLLGVLDVSDIAPSKRTFNEADVRLLSLFAGQAASAIANAQLFEDLKKSNIDLMSAYDTTIEGWSRAMDLRDHETEGHTLRVTDLTLKLARGMNQSESQLIHIRRGSLLHDIGKMGVPDSILLKEGNLSDEEWVIMRKHPQLAYEMLSAIEYLHDALDIPSNHHEKWDGTGYPRGLKGDEIPLAARIFSVVDVWDAIRSDRPYRKGWDTEKAIEYIKSQSGTHFDPAIVEAFLNLVREQ